MTSPVRLPRTKGPFVKWLKGRTEIVPGGTCPLKAYLKDCGATDPAVGFSVYDAATADKDLKLPDWARAVREAADLRPGFRWSEDWHPSTALAALKGVL